MPADAVLLIDLENMIGANARSARFEAKLDALTGQAGHGTPVVAACAGTRITSAGKKALKDRKIKLLSVNGTKDAADEALLDEAGKRARSGCIRFVVASHDSRFAKLADLGQLEILAWTTPKPAEKYASRAANVHRMSRPAASQAQPAKSRPGRARAESGRGVLASVAPEARDNAATRPLVVMPVVGVGAGALVAGVLFGTGVVLGAATVLGILGGRVRRLAPSPG